MWYCFNFLFTISTNFDVIVDPMIRAPGLKNYVFDGFNSCDKRYLMERCVLLVF